MGILRPQSAEVDYLLNLLVRDVADYDRMYTKRIKAVPLSDVSASFAMERIRYETPAQRFGACVASTG
ncbi:hypothetical protein [Parasphingorhabdus sp.]|uniref:hypothetical protein n=1 Tax=Parasphingorhabdus sp. TaxID=2709688 RepID=UPI0030015B81